MNQSNLSDMLDLSFSRKWNAFWVWPKGEPTGRNTYYFFRKEFNEENWNEPCLYITADTRYRVYLNDQLVGYGPPLCVSTFQYYDVYPLKDWLKENEANCLAIEVYTLEGEPDSQGGLLCEVTDNGGKTLLCTDSTWKAVRAEAWNSHTQYFRMSMYSPYQEHFDARKIPFGWKKPGFDDRNWSNTQIIRGRRGSRPPTVLPWSWLVERDIPYMKESPVYAASLHRVEESVDLMNRMRSEDLSISLSLPGQPLTYAKIDQAESLLQEAGETNVQCSIHHLMDHEFDGIYYPCVILDFGKSINAFLELEITGPAGAVIDIGYAERLINGYFNNAIEGMYADRYILREGHQNFRPFTWKSFRYVKLMFRNCTLPLTIQSIQAKCTEYPYDDAGNFHSSDEQMNRIFEMCRSTIRLCSNDSIMDTPWREQAQFVGDVAAVTLGGIYSCFGDTRLPAKFLKQSAANPTPSGLLSSVTNSNRNNSQHPDYSLWWIWGLWNHYLYTGEEQWIHRYYPQVLQIIYAFLRYVGDQGLIEDMPYAVFIDWANLDRKGICAPLNAIFYGITQHVVQMAVLKGDHHTALLLQSVRQRIKENFNRLFFSEEQECYVDAWEDGKQSPIISEQTNMAAIYWDLYEPVNPNCMVDRLLLSKELEHTESQPFFTMITLRALDAIGRFDLALDIIRKRWGRRMADRGATSTYEEWGLNGSWRTGSFAPIMRTQSHAWSAYPAEFLLKALIGFDIIEPGCRTVRIKPRQTKFDYAVTLPLPQGKLCITYQRGEFTISSPESVNVI